MEERRATSQSDQYWPTEHRINTLLKEIVKRTVSIGNPFIFGYHGTRLSYNTQTDFFFGLQDKRVIRVACLHRYPSHSNTCLCFVLVFICVHCFCRKWTRGTGGAYNRACLLPWSGVGDINCNSFLRALFYSPFYQNIFIIFAKT